MVSTSPKETRKKSFWNRSVNYRPEAASDKPQACPRLTDSQQSSSSRPESAGKSQYKRATTALPATSEPARAGASKSDLPVSKAGETRKTDHPILFQSYFKSVGPRTYAAQVKQASNGNQYLVITEGRRDKKTDQIRKYSVNVFSEDFEAFFNLLRDTTRWLKDHPLSPEFQAKRKKLWQKISSKDQSESKSRSSNR